jgi:hypothetical protein
MVTNLKREDCYVNTYKYYVTENKTKRLKLHPSCWTTRKQLLSLMGLDKMLMGYAAMIAARLSRGAW